jgi:hypothetical protein
MCICNSTVLRVAYIYFTFVTLDFSNWHPDYKTYSRQNTVLQSGAQYPSELLGIQVTIHKQTCPTILLLLHVFVVADTCLPSRCLVVQGGYFTEPLHSNDRRDIHTDKQIGGRDL